MSIFQASRVVAMMDVQPLIPVFDFVEEMEDASMSQRESGWRRKAQEVEEEFRFLE
jgi:hypothetical protein